MDTIDAGKIITLLKGIKKGVDYQCQLLETLVERDSDRSHSMGKQKEALDLQMKMLVGMFAGHPAMNANPDMAAMLKKMAEDRE